MSLVSVETEITVREEQLRVPQSEASAALRGVMREPAIKARAKLRFGPGRTCEQIARMLDKALVQAENDGIDMDQLILSGAQVKPAEHIIRIRRKAHGLADWISSATSDVSITLRPPGAAAIADITEAAADADAAEPVPGWVPEPETEAQLAVRDSLRSVLDPDLGVNIVDMGFVRRIVLDEHGTATVTMTLTSPACPLTRVMTDQMRNALSATGNDLAVEWQWKPSWRPQDITPEGREQLKAIGFSAF